MLTNCERNTALFSNDFSEMRQKSDAFYRDAPTLGRNHVDDAVSPPFKLMQEGREHLCCLRLGIVKQNNAASDPLDTGQNKVQFLLRRHPHPVACPDIRTKYHHSA